MSLVADGQWVILVQSGGEPRLVRVRTGGKTSAAKQQVPMDPIIGAPFGANFRVEPAGLVRDARTVEELSGAVGDTFANIAGAAQPDEHRTNAELFDDGKAQSLDDHAIRKLKEQGVHGAEKFWPAV